MNPAQELAHAELITDVESLLAGCHRWASADSDWPPLAKGKRLLAQMLTQVTTLRARWESPLVVATFGGTGVGKSSLVNALLGEELALSGKERPTTRQPTLLAHTSTELESTGFPLESVRVVRSAADVLRDFVLLDCPDPDSDDGGRSDSNLERLRTLLPWCDVLLYVSTQQKYRSARVVKEIEGIRAGCQLFFIQTHADRDSDIRDDWRLQLPTELQSEPMFLVDTQQALDDSRRGFAVKGEFRRLKELLEARLAHGQRLRIRNSNLLDKLVSVTGRCHELILAGSSGLELLKGQVASQQQAALDLVIKQATSELTGHRRLWEQRSLAATLDRWGLTPFSIALRAYFSQATLFASWVLWRARNPVQLAVAGAVQGANWLGQRAQSRQEEDSMGRIALLAPPRAAWERDRLILNSFLREAGFQLDLNQLSERFRAETVPALEQNVLQELEQLVDRAIERVGERQSGFVTRWMYEIPLTAYLLFIGWRVGQNFFVDTLIYGEPFLSTSFYIPAVGFLIALAVLLVAAFTRQLRRRISHEALVVASQLAQMKAVTGWFPQIEAMLQSVEEDIVSLQQLRRQIEDARHALRHAVSDQPMRATVAPEHA